MPGMHRAVVAVLVLAACSHAKQSVALYESGDYAGAARAADDGLAKHPKDDTLWAMRIRAALALGDAGAMAKAYESYIAERGDDDKDLLRDLAIATLGQALASPSARLKITAIETAAELKLEALSDQVIERLDDNDDRVQAAAAIAVIHADPRAPRIADDMLRSPNPEARRIAVDGVGKKVGKLAMVDIARAADDGDPRVRATALRWLGTLKDPDAVETCTAHMHDPDDGVRAAAALALASIGIGDLAANGKLALSDAALPVRLAGVDLYGAAHRDDLLVSVVDDPNPLVATEAAIQNMTSHPGAGHQPVERAIASADWTVRAGVANMLVRAVGKEGALTYARKLAADKEVAVRLAAARVLAHTGDHETAVRVFAEALTDPNEGVGAAADLADLGDPRGVKALSDDVRDLHRTPDQRAAAASMHRGARVVTPGLVAALADPNAVVRVAAAAALAALSK